LALETKHRGIGRAYPAWVKLRNFTLERPSIEEILSDLEAMEAHVTAAVEGTRHGPNLNSETFIAKRPLRAGELVTTEDVTIFPL
jgi:hypothetical protein